MVNLRSSQGKLHMKQVADWCGARMAAGRGGNQHGLKGGKAAIKRWFWHWRWRSRKAFTCSVQRWSSTTLLASLLVSVGAQHNYEIIMWIFNDSWHAAGQALELFVHTGNTRGRCCVHIDPHGRSHLPSINEMPITILFMFKNNTGNYVCYGFNLVPKASYTPSGPVTN